MRSNRVIALIAVAVLASLVAAAFAVDLSSAQGTTVDPARLVLGAGPPRTATAVLTFSDSSGVTATATCELDFAAGTADVQATAALSLATVSLEARLGDGRVELNVAQFESLVGAQWVSVRAPGERTNLGSLARFFRHPDLRFRSERGTVRRTATGAVSTLRASRVHLPSTRGLPVTLPRVATVVVTVMTGREGQLLSMDANLSSSHDDVRASLVVTAYDVPVSIPTVGRGVVTLSARLAREVFGTNAASIVSYLHRLGAL